MSVRTIKFDSLLRGNTDWMFPAGKYSMQYTDEYICVLVGGVKPLALDPKRMRVNLYNRNQKHLAILLGELFLRLTDPDPGHDNGVVRYVDHDPKNVVPGNLYWETDAHRLALIEEKSAPLDRLSENAAWHPVIFRQRNADGDMVGYDFSETSRINKKTGVIARKDPGPDGKPVPMVANVNHQLGLGSNPRKGFLKYRVYQLMFDFEEYAANPALNEVDHINQDWQCNEPWNYRWMTSAENKLNRQSSTTTVDYVPYHGSTASFEEFEGWKFGRTGEVLDSLGKLRVPRDPEEIEEGNVPSRTWYPRIGIKDKHYQIHVIMAYLFLWPEFVERRKIRDASLEYMVKSYVVNHIDHEKDNFFVENLEIITQSDNIRKYHAHKNRYRPHYS